jgi:hypothetical protein
MFCPRFVQPAQKILLPNGVPKEIVLQVENLPNPQVGHTGFQCIINIEGAKLMVPARVDEKYIVCDKTTVNLYIFINLDTILIENILIIYINVIYFSTHMKLILENMMLWSVWFGTETIMLIQ